MKFSRFGSLLVLFLLPNLAPQDLVLELSKRFMWMTCLLLPLSFLLKHAPFDQTKECLVFSIIGQIASLGALLLGYIRHSNGIESVPLIQTSLKVYLMCAVSHFLFRKIVVYNGRSVLNPRVLVPLVVFFSVVAMTLRSFAVPTDFLILFFIAIHAFELAVLVPSDNLVVASGFGIQKREKNE